MHDLPFGTLACYGDSFLERFEVLELKNPVNKLLLVPYIAISEDVAVRVLGELGVWSRQNLQFYC